MVDVGRLALTAPALGRAERGTREAWAARVSEWALGIFQDGPRAGQVPSGGLRRRHLAHLGPRSLLSRLVLRPLGLTSSCLGPSLRKALKCTMRRLGLRTRPGRVPPGTWPWQGARVGTHTHTHTLPEGLGWWVLGQACSPRQPLMWFWVLGVAGWGSGEEGGPACGYALVSAPGFLVGRDPQGAGNRGWGDGPCIH